MRYAGQSLELDVVARCLLPVSYEWRKNGKIIPGAVNPKLLLNDLTPADAALYSVRVSAAGSRAISPAEAVTVIHPSPRQLLAASGSTLLIDSAAFGKVLGAVWQHNDLSPTPSGRIRLLQNGRQLQIRGVDPADAGVFRCNITTPGGSLQSADIILTVISGAPELTEPVILPGGVVGAPYAEFIPVIVNPQRPLERLRVRGLPPGLSLDVANAQIIGRPTKHGTFKLRIQVGNRKAGNTYRSEIIIDPLPTGLAGSHSGLVERHAAINNSLGAALQLKITPRAAVSGFLLEGRKRLPFRGDLMTDAEDALPATLTVLAGAKRCPDAEKRRLTLSFDRLTGIHTGAATTGTTATEGSEAEHAELEGWHLPWHAKRQPADQRAGYHTMALLLDETHTGDLTVPQGSGFASFKISGSGAMRIRGSLADGAHLVAAPKLGPQGQMGLYAALYGRQTPGSITGRISQVLISDPSIPNRTHLSGELTWSRPTQSPQDHAPYASGFELVTLRAEGGQFVKTPFQLAQAAAGRDIWLKFSHANLTASAQPLEQVEVFLTVDNRMFAVPHPSGLTLKSNVKTGQISGQFELRDLHWRDPLPALWRRKVSYRGLIVPYPDGSQRGHGFFLLPQLPTDDPKLNPPPTLSGEVRLEK